MFEIRCIVGDKKLRDVLLSLRNLTIGAPSVTPVEALGPQEDTAPVASAKPNKKTAKRRTGGGFRVKGTGVIQILRPLIEKSGVEHISAREMKVAAEAAGYRPGAYSHGVKILLEEGSIKALGFGHYQVVKRLGDASTGSVDHAA